MLLVLRFFISGVKVVLLSQISEKYSGTQLQEMSPAITKHLLQKAREHRQAYGPGELYKKKPLIRHKLEPWEGVSFFYLAYG